MKEWFVNILIAGDQLLNTILRGHPDETLSSRAYRNEFEHKSWKVIRMLIDLLFFWQPNHCEQAFYSELERRHFLKTKELLEQTNGRLES